MRITLDIADDILLAIKERARRERRSAGEILSEIAREALTHRHRVSEASEPESFDGFEPLSPRGKAVSNELIDKLREDEIDWSEPSLPSTFSVRVDRPFQHRQVLPGYQELLDSGALRGGTDSTQIVREDRVGR